MTGHYWLSKPPTSNREEKIAEEYLNYIISTSTLKAIRVDKVATETTKDQTLTAIIKAITTNKPTIMTLTNKNYGSSSKLSLAHNGNIILKRYGIVLLQIFQAQVIKFAQTLRNCKNNSPSMRKSCSEACKFLLNTLSKIASAAKSSHPSKHSLFLQLQRQESAQTLNIFQMGSTCLSSQMSTLGMWMSTSSP